jgi:hypothetical protein
MVTSALSVLSADRFCGVRQRERELQRGEGGGRGTSNASHHLTECSQVQKHEKMILTAGAFGDDVPAGVLPPLSLLRGVVVPLASRTKAGLTSRLFRASKHAETPYRWRAKLATLRILSRH